MTSLSLSRNYPHPKQMIYAACDIGHAVHHLAGQFMRIDPPAP